MQSNKEQMNCMEILGGNLATRKAYEASGLDLYVESAPHLDSEIGGGDVYYVTSCASGRVTRVLLADVSGHGASVASLACSLKDALEHNVNTVSQSRFVRQMNHKFKELAEHEGQLATAVVATYFETQKRLSLGLAGHPNPFLYRARKRRWYKVNEQSVADNLKERFRNMPLGIVNDSDYPTRNVSIKKGDMLLLYSDAFIESFNRESSILGIEGVLEILNDLQTADPSKVIPELRRSIGALCPQNLGDDDATIILVHFTDRKPKIKDTLAAPFRMMRSVRDRTILQA